MTLTATERDLVDAASRWFDAHRAQFVDELCELLRYPSVSDESDQESSSWCALWA